MHAPLQILNESEREVEYGAYVAATAALRRKISEASLLAARAPSLELQVQNECGGLRRGLPLLSGCFWSSILSLLYSYDHVHVEHSFIILYIL